MLCSFFLSKCLTTRICAWLGLLTFLAHHLLAAWVSARLNGWYGEFYDVLGQHLEEASGDALELQEQEDAWASVRAQIGQLLADFLLVVAPMVATHPIASYLRNRWLLLWRVVLMESYIDRWQPTAAIEGASQRIHEDTVRFSAGVENAISKILSAVMKLIVFLPILGSMDASLVSTAAWVAAGGLGISIVVGHPLVALEVSNQVVEAELRRRLVLLETHPADDHHSFVLTIRALRANYRKLYAALVAFGYWLICFEQFSVVLPYLLVSQNVFAAAPDDRITLGELQQICHAFASVFEAFSMIGSNWASVNDFRATVRRLYAFEALLAADSQSRIHSEIEMQLAESADLTQVTIVAEDAVPVNRLREVKTSGRASVRCIR